MTRWLLVTGKLARPFVEQVAESLTTPDRQVQVLTLPISVAALMTTSWVARQLSVPAGIDRVVLPGLCQGEVEILQTGRPYHVVKGPPDIWDLPGAAAEIKERARPPVTIVAEIQNAPGWTVEDLKEKALAWHRLGVNIIDLGIPQEASWPGLESAIDALHQEGLALSVDTADKEMIRRSVAKGADLILSATAENREVCVGAREVVAIWEPDDADGRRLEKTVEFLSAHHVPVVLDPILGTPGLDLGASLERARRLRRRYPELPMMWGLHHVTEFVQADSVGINAAFFMLATEYGVTHILTTEVAPWTSGSPEELVTCRRLWRQAPGYWLKGVENDLLVAKTAAYHRYTADECRTLQKEIRDRNFRILTGEHALWCFNREVMVELEPSEAEWTFPQLRVTDPAHSFYLGHELARAAISVVLGKPFRQDAPLRFGYRQRWYGKRGLRPATIGQKRSQPAGTTGDED